ncbi:MAG: hypothetical protein II661_06245 [Bacteroidales bacterium]|nr:hypothetical protein [Bacteroidales bacterium]
MRRNQTEYAFYRSIAEATDIPEQEVRSIVLSFFQQITQSCRKLPFGNARKIFSKAKFDTYVTVWNIPYIGRMGPVYSRYLKWRNNEAKQTVQASRSRYRNRISRSEIENMADEILSGKTPTPLIKKKPTELYHRVWYVESDGKRLARQVIPKEE